MSVRLLGCILILAGCLFIAFVRTKAARERLDTLSSMSDMLGLMAGELTLNMSPLPELVETLKSRCQGEARRFLSALSIGFDALGREDFSGLWFRAAGGIKGISELERQELNRLGNILGRCELDTQAQALFRTEEFFRQEWEILRQNIPQKRKLDFGLCGGAGIILLIMLI